MLDVIVLIAVAVTAVAFAVGLILHSGIAQIPALIATGRDTATATTALRRARRLLGPGLGLVAADFG